MLSPGRTEYVEKYLETVGELQERGFVVLVHDWRGQGLSDRLLSDRLRGHAVRADDFVGDFRILLDAYESRLPRPWLNLSHSMGAALTTLAMAAGERRFAGALLSAPMFAIRTGQIPAWLARSVALALARSCGSLYVTAAEVRLSHDPVREGRWRAQLEDWPDLRLGNVTWGWLNMALDAIERLGRDPGMERIDCPVVALAAGADDLIDLAGLRRVAARLPRGRTVEVEGAYHELLMESDVYRDQVWSEFDRLTEAVMPPRG